MSQSSAPRLAHAGLAPVPPACYLCGGPDLALRFPARGEGETGPEAYHCTSFGHRRHPPIWGCEKCGMLSQWPMKPAEEIVAAYRAVEDPLYMAEKENRYLTFRKAAKLLGLATGRRLLDVGAYCGYFLDVAREAGFRAEGLELSRWAAEHARSLGFTVHGQTLAERAQSGDKYDVVTMWDVIEHVPDPRADLQHALELLKPGGRIYVATIDAGSLIARVLGARWPWLMDMHLHYFDRSTLPALLEEAGFVVTEKRDYTHVVSADYLLRKVAASFPALKPLAWTMRRVMPGRVPVPVNLGDNMVVVAHRP